MIICICTCFFGLLFVKQTFGYVHMSTDCLHISCTLIWFGPLNFVDYYFYLQVTGFLGSLNLLLLLIMLPQVPHIMGYHFSLDILKRLILPAVSKKSSDDFLHMDIFIQDLPYTFQFCKQCYICDLSQACELHMHLDNSSFFSFASGTDNFLVIGFVNEQIIFYNKHFGFQPFKFSDVISYAKTNQMFLFQQL